MTDACGEGVLGGGSAQALRQGRPGLFRVRAGWSQGAGEPGLEGETGEGTGVRAEGDPMRGWEGQA